MITQSCRTSLLTRLLGCSRSATFSNATETATLPPPLPTTLSMTTTVAKNTEQYNATSHQEAQRQMPTTDQYCERLHKSCNEHFGEHFGMSTIV